MPLDVAARAHGLRTPLLKLEFRAPSRDPGGGAGTWWTDVPRSARGRVRADHSSSTLGDVAGHLRRDGSLDGFSRDRPWRRPAPPPRTDTRLHAPGSSFTRSAILARPRARRRDRGGAGLSHARVPGIGLWPRGLASARSRVRALRQGAGRVRVDGRPELTSRAHARPAHREATGRLLGDVKASCAGGPSMRRAIDRAPPVARCRPAPALAGRHSR